MPGPSYHFSFIIKADGTLWGAGDAYYVGLSGASTLTQIGVATDWVSVSCGRAHAAAIKSDGTLWTWGKNEYGEIGPDDMFSGRQAPAQVGTATDWVEVSCGHQVTLLRKSDGTIWGCGRGTWGQLGQGNEAHSEVILQIGSATDWASVRASAYSAYALKTDGKLWAWGANGAGELGLGDTTQRNAPVEVDAVATWLAVEGGLKGAVAVKTDGTLWAAGENHTYRFCDLPFTSSTFAQVGTDSDWARAYTEYTTSGYTLAYKTDGTLWSVGANVQYCLGVEPVTSGVFAQVGAAADWEQLALGWAFVLGLDASGDLYGWGLNSSGELGLGDKSYRDVPTLVAAGVGAVQDAGDLIEPLAYLTELPVAAAATLPAVSAEIVFLWRCHAAAPTLSGELAQGRLIDIAIGSVAPRTAGTSQSDAPLPTGSFPAGVSTELPSINFEVTAGGTFALDVATGVPTLRTTIKAGTSVNIRACVPAVVSSMYREIEWSISLQAPSPSQAAEFYADLSATFDTWAVNASNAGHSAYTGYAFTSFFFFHGDYYGVASDGIYKLEGSDDAGEAIQPVAMFGVSNLGTDKVKRLDSVYPEVISDAAGTISVTVSVDGSAEQTFSGSVQEAVTAPVRCKISRGLSGRYWQIGVGCTTDGKLEITSLRAVTVPLSRRV